MEIKDYFRNLGMQEVPTMYKFMKHAKAEGTLSIDIIIDYVIPDASKPVSEQTNPRQKISEIKSKKKTIKSIDQVTKTPENKIAFFDGIEVNVIYEAKHEGYPFYTRFVKTYQNQDEALLYIDNRINWLKKKIPEIPKEKYRVKDIQRRNIQHMYESMVYAIKKDRIKKAEKAKAINNVLYELKRTILYKEAKESSKYYRMLFGTDDNFGSNNSDGKTI